MSPVQDRVYARVPQELICHRHTPEQTLARRHMADSCLRVVRHVLPRTAAAR